MLSWWHATHRQAQELLSRLEAEDFLRELETEEERAKRAAGGYISWSGTT